MGFSDKADFSGEFSAVELLLVFMGVTAAVTAVSLLCYVLYYRLSPAAGFISGMIPLSLAAMVMAGIDIALVSRCGF